MISLSSAKTLWASRLVRESFGWLERYPGPRPRENVVPPGKRAKIVKLVAKHHAGAFVTDEYEADERAVCLSPGRVRGQKASTEEALLHVYRYAPTKDFAHALQAVLMESTKLNWHCLRRQPDWKDLAGGFDELVESLRGFSSMRASAVLDAVRFLRTKTLYNRAGFLPWANREKGRLSDEDLEPFKRGLSEHVHYFGTSNGQGRFVPEWRVMIPQSAEGVVGLRRE